MTLRHSLKGKGEGDREQTMVNKIILTMLATAMLAFVNPSEAQQPKKVPRIGYQSAGSSGEREEAFRQGLRELGYVEGQNIVIEWRFAQGKPDQVPRNAAELVRLKVDVIVTGGADGHACSQRSDEHDSHSYDK